MKNLAQWQDIRSYLYSPSIEDTLGVQHRNDFENKVLPQSHGALIIAQQILQCALEDPRRIAFSWVHSTGENDHLPILDGRRHSVRVGDGEDGHLVVVERVAQLLHFEQYLARLNDVGPIPQLHLWTKGENLASEARLWNCQNSYEHSRIRVGVVIR